jgi:hypothetical protein
VAFFVLGYFSPTPDVDDEDEADEHVGPDEDAVDAETAVDETRTEA